MNLYQGEHKEMEGDTYVTTNKTTKKVEEIKLITIQKCSQQQARERQVVVLLERPHRHIVEFESEIASKQINWNPSLVRINRKNMIHQLDGWMWT